MRSQKGVLIKSPKLQGHDGGGKCPEFNCYWIGRDYVNFEPLSYDKTTDIFDKLNESENEFDWVKDIKLSLGFDDLKLGDVVKLKDYDNNNWEIIDIYMSDPNMTGKPSEKRVKFKTPFKNSYLELWKSPLNSNDYFELVNRNPDRVYFNVNESKDDEFKWAEDIVKNIPDVVDYRTVKQGDKVVPGKDWEFGNQAQGSVYGIVDLEQYEGAPSFIDDSTDEEFHQYWVHVDWVDKNDNPNFRNNYRVGPNYYDLKYYVPKPINIEESVDDFDWVKDIVNADLNFGSVKGDLKIGDVITVTGAIKDTNGTPLVDLDEEPFLVVKNYKMPGKPIHRIELNWFNPSSKRPNHWQHASINGDDGKDIISFTDECSEWDDGLIVKFLKK